MKGSSLAKRDKSGCHVREMRLVCSRLSRRVGESEVSRAGGMLEKGSAYAKPVVAVVVGKRKRGKGPAANGSGR